MRSRDNGSHKTWFISPTLLTEDSFIASLGEDNIPGYFSSTLSFWDLIEGSVGTAVLASSLRLKSNCLQSFSSNLNENSSSSSKMKMIVMFFFHTTLTKTESPFTKSAGTTQLKK